MALAINTAYADGNTVTFTNLNALVTEAGDGAALFNASNGDFDFVVELELGQAISAHKPSSQQEVAINHEGVDIDFRVASDTVTNMLLIDAASNQTSIAGTALAGYVFTVNGDMVIQEGSTHTVLTVSNTNASGSNHATVVITGPGNATLQLNDTSTTGTDDAIYNIASADGTFTIGAIDDDAGAGNMLMTLYPNGNVAFNSLPTSNPGAGLLWNNSGVINVGT